MRRKRDIEQDIEREIGQDVRRIMDGENVRDVGEESGPQLYPGMEDVGIGSSVGDDTRIYEQDSSDIRGRASSGYDGRNSADHYGRNSADHYGRNSADHYGRNSSGYDRRDPSDAYERNSFGTDGSGGAGGGWREPGEEDGYPGDEEDNYLSGEERDDFDENETILTSSRRGPYLFIACAFGLIFLLLSAHLVYFNLRMKDEILASPYNRRQNAQAKLVKRGKILSIDGATLARTDTWDEETEERVYPYANIFAHVVGFTTHGKSGLESIANYQLLTSHINIIDQVINEFLKRKSEGDTVVSTLSADLQETAYYALGDYRGAVVILEPKTGAIRAMVSKPNFDPNTLAEVWDDMVSDSSNSNLVNRATQGLYPPGSTFKIVTALSYYRAHHTFEGFSFDCAGELTVDDYTVHCYKGTVHGQEDFQGAFAHSCNTAFSRIGLDLGAARLTQTASSLLFGESLPSAELLSSKSRWSLEATASDSELVQTAFGQGKTLVTPYHMALLVSAIANDGLLMKPYLIDHIENAGGDLVSSSKSVAYRTILSYDEAEALTGLMEAVVNEGSASALSGRGYRVAGKTGSAEYARSDGTIGTHSWFVGFTNPEDPDLVIAVLAENGGAGSSTAVPIAAEILDHYYYG